VIKINLLPPWINEPRRILVLSIISLIIGGMGAGFMIVVKNDLTGHIDPYYKDVAAFEAQTQLCKKQVEVAAGLKGDQGKYDEYVDFFTGAKLKAYNGSIADVLEEVATKVGTFPGAYYEKVTIKGDKSVQLDGKIKGLMNFVRYYFQMKAAGMTLAANAMPYSTPLEQEITLKTTGSLTKTVLPAPTPPSGNPAVDYKELYKAGGAAPAPGGAPAPTATTGEIPKK